MKIKPWFIYALVTTVFWGIWGAFIEIPEKAGFPGTMIYVVWSVTMIIPALVALKTIKWKIEFDTRSILYGLVIGLLGAGGQLILFAGAITNGPAYLIFPIISLSPVMTILLSYIFLKERASRRGWFGIIVALIAIPLLSYQDPANSSHGIWWLIFALLVFAAWGLQAFFMRLANKTMKAESIFFYMMVTGLLLAPIALLMTDFSKPILIGFKGPYLTFFIQILNSIGALCIVYAFRYGKAIVVSPMTNAVAPVITVIISLIIYMVIPHPIILTGMILALFSIFLLAFEDEN
ncbi:MAG: DMT family transporter [Bacteroidales bacterium]|nr:DMT family transporter [Bacteroidales bacterium]